MPNSPGSRREHSATLLPAKNGEASPPVCTATLPCACPEDTSAAGWEPSRAGDFATSSWDSPPQGPDADIRQSMSTLQEAVTQNVSRRAPTQRAAPPDRRRRSCSNQRSRLSAHSPALEQRDVKKDEQPAQAVKLYAKNTEAKLDEPVRKLCHSGVVAAKKCQHPGESAALLDLPTA